MQIVSNSESVQHLNVDRNLVNYCILSNWLKQVSIKWTINELDLDSQTYVGRSVVTKYLAGAGGLHVHYLNKSRREG